MKFGVSGVPQGFKVIGTAIGTEASTASRAETKTVATPAPPSKAQNPEGADTDAVAPDEVAEETPASAPVRDVIEDPNFESPVKPITEFMHRPDFPKCCFGEHVDIGSYVGVVVEIVKHSLKVRSAEGMTRSYNADGLRKIYGQG